MDRQADIEPGYRDFYDVLKLMSEDDVWYVVDAAKGTYKYRVLEAMKQLKLILVAEYKNEIDHIKISKQGIIFFNYLLRIGFK